MITAPIAPSMLRESGNGEHSGDSNAMSDVFLPEPTQVFPKLPLLDRRTFFKGSVLGIGALWIGTIAKPLQAESLPAKNFELLSETEVAIVTAIANALFPAGGSIPQSGEEAGLIQFMDQYLKAADPGTAKLIRLLFRIFEYGPIIFAESASRLSRLSVEDATRHLEGWADSSIYFRRAGMQTIKLFFGMGFYANEDVRAVIGWKNECPSGEVNPAKPSVLYSGDSR